MVGLPASGKTTLAREIQAERGALRLTPDEWMIPMLDDNEASGKRDVLEGRFVWLALQALRSGVDVILDFGVWSRDERRALRSLAADIGAPCELVYLSVDLSEQPDRIRRRAKSEPGTTFAINEVELRRFAKLFVEPDLDELEGTVIPAPPAEVRSWRDWAAARWPTSAEG